MFMNKFIRAIGFEISERKLNHNMGIDVEFGEEYITELSFAPDNLTIATNTIPEPFSFCILSSCCLAVLARRLREVPSRH